MEDGVWRTIAGRRVFIKKGQSLSDAMRKSGKFKTQKSNQPKQEHVEEAKEIMDDMRFLDEESEGYEEALQEIKERYAELREKEGNNQSRQSKEIGEALKDIEKEDVIKGIEKVKTQKELLKLRTKGEQITGDPGTDNWDDKFAKKFDAAYQKKEREMVASGKSKTMKEEQSGASEQELKDELYHNVRMLNEMERRLSGRYKITEEERDKLERRAAHYEATADEIRGKLKERKTKTTSKKLQTRLKKRLKK